MGLDAPYQTREMESVIKDCRVKLGSVGFE